MSISSFNSIIYIGTLFDLRNTIGSTDFRQVHSFTMRIGVGEQIVDLVRERRNNNWPVVYCIFKSNRVYMQ